MPHVPDAEIKFLSSWFLSSGAEDFYHIHIGMMAILIDGADPFKHTFIPSIEGDTITSSSVVS